MMMDVEITTVQRAHNKYTGLRTPIPATYARELGLKAGDEIAWELGVKGEIKLLIIRKHEEETKE